MNPKLMLGDSEIADLTNFESPNFYDKSHTIPNFTDFIIDRIPSRSRKDINTILQNWNLPKYNIYDVSLKTRLINPMDKYWIRLKYTETFNNTVLPILSPNSITSHSPAGNNIKFYTYHKGKFGIRKKRLSSVMYDNESEIMCYSLSKLLNIPCCPCEVLDENWIFSEYLYDFNKCDFNHVRMDIENYDGDLYNCLLRTYPNFKDDINKMILFDFITRQDDRHRSNIAVYNNKSKFYPIYDNGRSLFFEDREDFMQMAISDPILYSTSFGDIGTYYDIVQSIPNPSKYLNLNISLQDIKSAVNLRTVPHERQELLVEWICKTIGILKSLDKSRIKHF